MFGFREVRANRKLDQASFRVTNYSKPKILRHRERRGVRWLQRELHTADYGAQGHCNRGRSTPARCATRNRRTGATTSGPEVRPYHRRVSRYHHHPPWASRGRLVALVALLAGGGER